MTTHAELLAAIDNAWTTCANQERHLDTLRAILERHRPEQDDYGVESCRICLDDQSANPWESAITAGSWWPCLDAQTVETALRKMGALE